MKSSRKKARKKVSVVLPYPGSGPATTAARKPLEAKDSDHADAWHATGHRTDPDAASNAEADATIEAIRAKASNDPPVAMIGHS